MSLLKISDVQKGINQLCFFYNFVYKKVFECWLKVRKVVCKRLTKQCTRNSLSIHLSVIEIFLNPDNYLSVYISTNL